VARYTVVRIADEIVIDLMARACDVEYEAAMADAVVLMFDDVPVPVASPQTLIRTKDTVRPSDQADRRYLQALIDASHRR
jgi:hypothetical protein